MPHTFVKVAGGSDFPPGPFAPLMGIQGMVTRTGWDGQTWGVNQRITVEEALRVNTINGAYNSHEEAIKGSIIAGKLADFVVLAELESATAPLFARRTFQVLHAGAVAGRIVAAEDRQAFAPPDRDLADVRHEVAGEAERILARPLAEVAVYYYVDEMTHAEIAGILGCSPHPNARAIATSRRAPSLAPSGANTELQDSAKDCLSEPPHASPWALRSLTPSSVVSAPSSSRWRSGRRRLRRRRARAGSSPPRAARWRDCCRRLTRASSAPTSWKCTDSMSEL